MILTWNPYNTYPQGYEDFQNPFNFSLKGILKRIRLLAWIIPILQIETRRQRGQGQFSFEHITECFEKWVFSFILNVLLCLGFCFCFFK